MKISAAIPTRAQGARTGENLGPKPSADPKSCKTIVLDYFHEQRTGREPHGVMVTNVAEQLDGEGATIAQELTSEFSSGLYRGRRDFVAKMLHTEGLNPDEAFEAVDTFTQQRAVAFYELTGKEVELATASELKNSTLNASFSVRKSTLAENLYGEASMAWRVEKNDDYKNLVNNYASAYDLDSSKILNEDPAVHRPERQKLQQAIIDHVSDVVDNDPKVESARNDFRETVREFEAGNNSMVVSAGNEGSTDDNLSARNGGLSLDFPEDFETSLLAVPEVTTVGATKIVGGEAVPAQYGSRGPAIDVYADGDYQSPDPEQPRSNGTSFSAPRTSKAMRELHCENPLLSSSQVESLMLHSLTTPLELEDGTSIPVLN